MKKNLFFSCIIIFIILLFTASCFSGCKTGKEKIDDTGAIDAGDANQEPIEDISLDRVLEIINNNEDYVILDVRSAEEHKDGHLNDSVSMPVLELESRISELSKDMHLIVYGGKKDDSFQAAKILTENGFKFVYDMGSISEWRARGYPLVAKVVMDADKETEEDRDGEQNDYQPITVEESFKLFQDGNYLFLDVRSKEEYDEGHIKGALHIPVEELKNRIHEIPDVRGIITYCSGIGCGLSGWAASILVERGFKEVYEMKGEGIYEWIEENYPIEKSS